MESKQRIVEIFERNKTVASYSLFDRNHPLRIFLGSNEDGEKSMLIISDSKNEQAVSSKFIKVRFTKRSDGTTSLSFDLIDERFEDIFYKFCDDVIKNTYTAKVEEGLAPVIKRYEVWQDFFKRDNSFLSKNEIMGLIGELLFIKKRLIGVCDSGEIIKAYRGIDKAHKDFDLNDAWYEIKTVHNGADRVTISSLEQLDSDRRGYLEIITLEEGGYGENVVTLNRLVDSIMETMDSYSGSKLSEKMLRLGYVRDDYYDAYEYGVVSASEYEVRDGFPKLSKETVPNGIVGAKYEISISVIEGYKEKAWM